jgi:anaphase-promoting complex subunit 3
LSLGADTPQQPQGGGAGAGTGEGVVAQQQQQQQQIPQELIDAAHNQLMTLLRTLGSAYNLLCQYLCSEALAHFYQLSSKQYESAWVQHQVGKAHFEMANYAEAEESFELMHRRAPHRMAGLDVYSTNLWHLKKEVELCYLAQEVSDFEKRSPEVWCVIGNCFSLQKEHETALKFFQRAIQIDPSFTYAYTLSGHEYVSNEDFEKAVACYRHAIRTNSRHYQAWYGLGTIYYRQEKFDLAEYHFRRALVINPRSSVLYCYLGMVLHANRKYDEALTMLAQASDMQPSNPQARFQRANVLITLERYEDALTELTVSTLCIPLGSDRRTDVLDYAWLVHSCAHICSPSLWP